MLLQDVFAAEVATVVGVISYRKYLSLPKITPFSLVNVVLYRKFTAGKGPQVLALSLIWKR
jgi:hypothetical protein